MLLVECFRVLEEGLDGLFGLVEVRNDGLFEIGCELLFENREGSFDRCIIIKESFRHILLIM